MRAEINNENKAKFFAQYWGQRVFKSPINTSYTLIRVAGWSIDHPSFYLELTPLSMISDADLRSGSPRIGDMIARNPNNHLDQWLVAQQYFQDNFELEITKTNK